MASRNRTTISRRSLMAGATAAAGSSLLGNVSFSFAQGARIEPGKPIPPLTFEHYSDEQRTQSVRLFAEELAKIGIRVTPVPMATSAFLGKVYRQHRLTLALGGLGGALVRIDPDFYLRSIYHTKGFMNASGYSNPEFDAVVEAQLRETDSAKRKDMIERAQRIYARDLPSWWTVERSLINPVNTRHFKNYEPAKGTGFEAYSVFPFLKVEPTGSVKMLNLATFFKMSSGNLFTERAANGEGYLRFIYDTFLRYDNDLNLIPWAAESFKVVDPTTYDIKIRDGMKWHDGKPVTVEDAKFTFDFLLKWKPPAWEVMTSMIKGAEIVNSSTVRVTLHQPSAIFTTVSLAQITLLPQHVWKDVTEKYKVSKPEEFNMARFGSIGSGPFKFDSFQRDVNYRIVANPDHWYGRPKIDGINYIQAANVEQLKGGMETENIHVVGDGLTAADGNELAKREYIKLFVVPHPSVQTFFLDMRQPLFQDPAIRQAMYFATPKAKILDIVLAGGGQVARRTPMPPSYDQWIPSDLPGDEYSIERAKDVLSKAGYSWDRDGNLLMKQG
jgi:peptide/nickel transport system substrate-binding protein